MDPDWPRIASHFDLGELEMPPEPVSGGWVGRVWRLATTRGTFALKELPQPGYPAWRRDLNRAVAFESSAWSSGAIPMPEPIATISGRLLFSVVRADRTERYRCHSWIEGQPCLARACSPADARSVGASVAQMFALARPRSTTRTLGPSSAIESFDATIREAFAAEKPWAEALAALGDRVQKLRRDDLCLRAAALPVRMCHRDLDPKNAVALPNGDVAITDWDYAGMRLPASEALIAALSFAGGPEHADPMCLQAFREGYGVAGGPGLDLAFAATPAIEEGLNWIMSNAWLSLGHRNVSAERRALAQELVADRIATWPAQSDIIARWAFALGSIP